MKYIMCDRCGAKYSETDKASEVLVITNYNLCEDKDSKASVDLCKTCTRQFFSHFMKNHWNYK